MDLFNLVYLLVEQGETLTAIHFITGILTVYHLVTAARVGDAGTVLTLELRRIAQGHWGSAESHTHTHTDEHFIIQ